MEINQVVESGIKKLAELNLDGRFPRYMKDDIYHKPSYHSQLCYVCHDGIEKDDLVRKEQSGATSRGYPRYTYAHLDCFLALLFHTILEIKR